MAQYLFIKSGWIVKETTAAPVNILVEGQRIVAAGPEIEAPPEAEVIDASGLLVLPGAIDSHVHLREPGAEHKEDITSGTRAALAGGVTTVLVMPNTDPPNTDIVSLARVMDLAQQKAVCDFGFFIGATPDNAAQVARLPDVVGLKMYMGSSTGPLLVDEFGAQYSHFKAFPPKRPIAIHAEDETAVRCFAQQGQRRPPICAALATAQVLVLAEQLNRRVHICHLSTAHEIELVRAAKVRGVPVTCEVTPHHLFLSDEAEWRLLTLAKMNPPLRSPADVKTLWQNLSWIDTVASDHAPHTLQEKKVSPTEAPSGIPGLETMLPLLLTAAGDGRFLLAEVVRLTSCGPAEIFGLARKGRIAPGYDADLVLVDSNARWTIDQKKLFTKCGWTPFNGRQVKGQVKRVYLRGRLAYADGEILVEPGYGQPVKLK